MKVLVIGAGGVIGQHMVIAQPAGVEAVFTRMTESGLYRGFDLCHNGEPYDTLTEIMPDVVVNLAGENSVDVVEQHPRRTYDTNVKAPIRLRDWCDDNNRHLIHVSSQAVLDPVNEYGKQKAEADEWIQKGKNWTIVRPTFVLGIRPFPGVGRENPAERILAGREEKSVDDRYFSVSFAWDVAEYIWKCCVEEESKRWVHHVGQGTMSRLSVARALGVYPKAVRHDSLGVAPRPVDTTYKDGNIWPGTDIGKGMSRLEAEFGQRSLDTAPYRAKEIAAFLNKPWGECLEKLNTGFGPLHNAVSDDFREAAPKNDSDLLLWYRTTEAYIWELTAYHLDKGFNYSGMTRGIAQALVSKGVKKVLCLGDGVGDLSLEIERAGMTPWYNDLFCGTTATFAASRFLMRLGDSWDKKIGLLETAGFDPVMMPEERLNISLPGDPEPVVFDAIVSLDFLEHVPNVEAWVRSIYANLKPGGWFVAQNAFNMGSGEQGAMPMHLAVNDHYERDWDPLLFSLGFVQEKSNWYRKP